LQPFVMQNLKVRNSLTYMKHDLDIVQYRKARPFFRLGPLSSIASLLSKFVGVTRGTQGRIHFVWQMDSFLDIPRFQEAADNVEWELEDMI
jgi:hypothetical protein